MVTLPLFTECLCSVYVVCVVLSTCCIPLSIASLQLCVVHVVWSSTAEAVGQARSVLCVVSVERYR